MHGLYNIKKGAENLVYAINYFFDGTRWFKYDRDYLCVSRSEFVPVIFEPPCIITWESTCIAAGVFVA
jgi:hypothetical protein